MPLQPILEQRLQDIVIALDLAGTFVFAISGAMLGVRRELDIFGVLVLSFAASTAGGIARDLLLGATPPAAIADWRYLAVAMVAGLTTFIWFSPVSRLRTPIQILDAAGLALFAVSGAQKALAFGLDPVGAALLGMLTGIGGGIARDILVARTPAVLRGEFYAVAALTGAMVVVLGARLGWSAAPTALGAGAVCFALRITAVRRSWNLPVARAVAKSGDRGDGDAR